MGMPNLLLTLRSRKVFIVIPLGLLLLFMIVLPNFLSPYKTILLSKILVFALLALSYDLIWGRAGIANFGHAVFFGLGAYAFGLVSKHVDLPGVTYLAILAAIVVPMIVGLFLSITLIYGKIIGAYFAIVTLILGYAFETIAMSWTDVTGGMNGLYGFPTPRLGIPGLWEFELSGFTVPYYVILFSLVLFLIGTWYLMERSNFGKVISAIKNNSNRMEYLGYNVNLFKTIIFIISCGIAGFAGWLYVPVSTITPMLLGMAMSIQIIVWVAVGGRGSLWGAVAGALIVSGMQEYLSGAILDFWLLAIGIFFILVVMIWPNGFAGFYYRVCLYYRK